MNTINRMLDFVVWRAVARLMRGGRTATCADVIALALLPSCVLGLASGVLVKTADAERTTAASLLAICIGVLGSILCLEVLNSVRRFADQLEDTDQDDEGSS